MPNGAMTLAEQMDREREQDERYARRLRREYLDQSRKMIAIDVFLATGCVFAFMATNSIKVLIIALAFGGAVNAMKKLLVNTIENARDEILKKLN